MNSLSAIQSQPSIAVNSKRHTQVYKTINLEETKVDQEVMPKKATNSYSGVMID